MIDSYNSTRIKYGLEMLLGGSRETLERGRQNATLKQEGWDG
jgi:hypothetical protein